MRFCFRAISAFLFVVVLGGCVSPSSQRKSQADPSVRKVDYTAVPELKEWAERSERSGNDLYPKLLAMLTEEPGDAPREFNIVFHKTLRNKDRGVALGKTIRINAIYFAATNQPDSYRDNPENFDKVLVHEMAHIATGRGFRFYSKKSPSHWAEGVADYARYKLGYTNGWSCPECDVYPHYTSGYSCAGAFLLFVDAKHGSNIVRRLAAQLRRGTYSDDFFREATGSSLDVLWNEFKQTAAFRPGAEDLHRIHLALGYVNGMPPKNLHKRVVAFLEKKPGGALTLEAAGFLRRQVDLNKLPGATESERRGKRFALNLEPAEMLYGSDSATFPARRKMFGRFDNEAIRFYYVVVRSSKDTPWKLEKAWRADGQGKVLEDFKVE